MNQREEEFGLTARINMNWDEEAKVWIATSDDVPGLVLESGSFDALVERVKIAIPEMMELNGGRNESYHLTYTAHREDRIVAYSQ